MVLEFLRDVLPHSGVYCIFLGGTKAHYWFDTIEDLAAGIEARAGVRDVYFATASFEDETAGRKQANVSLLRSLRLDLDAGAAKYAEHGDAVYPTQQEALADVIRFSKSTGIAPTRVVNSGAGLHVYYVLDRDLTPQEWLPLAKGLKKLCAEHGLRTDSSVTADTARVLRPVGTLHKSGATVTSIGRRGPTHGVSELLTRLPEPEFPVALPSRPGRTSINDDLLDSFNSVPKDANRIADHCPQMALMRDTQGDVGYNHWMAALSVIKVCRDKEEIAAAWNARREETGHDNLDWHGKMGSLEHGPSKCETFDDANPGVCDGCQYKGKIKSPAVLGYVPREEQPLPEAPTPVEVADEVVDMPFMEGDWDRLGLLPNGYKVVPGPYGTLQLRHEIVTTDEDTGAPKIKLVDFSQTVFWFDHWADADGAKNSAVVEGWKWDPSTKRRVKLHMDQAALGNRTKLGEWLASQAIHHTSAPRAKDCMDNYMRDQMARIMVAGRKQAINGRLGPRILPDGTLVVAHGKYLIYPDGHIELGIIGDRLESFASMYSLPLPTSHTNTWGAGVWRDIHNRAKRHVEFLRRYYDGEGFECYRLAIMLGLASPLMPFVTGDYHEGNILPKNGLSVSLFSTRSGRGKTAMVKAMMAAFGDPEALVKESTRGATTDKARILRLVQSGTMPAVMDEMGNEDSATVAGIISAVANAAGRETATVDQGVNTSGGWALINFITTNTSVRAKISEVQSESTAIQNRLFEMTVNDTPDYTPEQLREFETDYPKMRAECIGALGGMIHLAMCKAGPAKLNGLMREANEEVLAITRNKSEARFQRRGMAAVIVLHRILERIGLSPFDLEELKATFAEQFDANQEIISEVSLPSDPVTMLSRFLNEIREHTLITQNMVASNENRTEIPLNNRVPAVPMARFIASENVIYVSSDAFMDWCRKRRVDPREIKTAAVRFGAFAEQSSGRLTMPLDLARGTKEATGVRVQCYKVMVPALTEKVRYEPEMAGNVSVLRRLEVKGAAPGRSVTSKSS